jgi:hypothetical protein
VEILGKAAELQRAEDLRRGGIAEVDREQRIRLAVGAEVGDAAVKARGVDALVGREILDGADDLQRAVEDVEPSRAGAVAPLVF